MNKLKQVSEIWERKWNVVKDLERFLDVEKTPDTWTHCHFGLIDRKLKKLPSDALFLEAGCGLGQWCIYASQKYRIQSLGVDACFEAVERSNKHIHEKQLERVKLMVDDLNNTLLQENSFDFFVSLGVVEHQPDPKKMISNLFKVTKREGEGLISVPNIYSVHAITRPLAQLVGIWNLGYARSFSPKQLKIMAEECGFKVLNYGVVPSGVMFGSTLTIAPFFGKFLQKLSYFIESRQKLFGFISYVWVKK